LIYSSFITYEKPESLPQLTSVQTEKVTSNDLLESIL